MEYCDETGRLQFQMETGMKLEDSYVPQIPSAKTILSLVTLLSNSDLSIQ